MTEEQTENLVKAFLLNKREDYERDLKDSGRDGWKEETEGLLDLIQNNHNSIYERRKEIDGVGIVYAEGKMGVITRSKEFLHVGTLLLNHCPLWDGC